MKTVASRWLVCLGISGLLLGCNAVLDNEPRTLAGDAEEDPGSNEDDATSEPVPPGDDADDTPDNDNADLDADTETSSDASADLGTESLDGRSIADANPADASIRSDAKLADATSADATSERDASADADAALGPCQLTTRACTAGETQTVPVACGSCGKGTAMHSRKLPSRLFCGGRGAPLRLASPPRNARWAPRQPGTLRALAAAPSLKSTPARRLAFGEHGSTPEAAARRPAAPSSCIATPPTTSAGSRPAVALGASRKLRPAPTPRCSMDATSGSMTKAACFTKSSTSTTCEPSRQVTARPRHRKRGNDPSR